MDKLLDFHLSKVSPTPATLRAIQGTNAPASSTLVNLAQLFQQYYFDSYPKGPPNPDFTRFEYLNLVSSAPDFRFLSHVRHAGLIKRRALSAEMGQAFCRLLLHDHFRIVYFAHLSDILNKPTHAAFNGMRVSRLATGSVPDYLCARKVTKPYIAEAKGRFSNISFASREWQEWQAQFTRIQIVSANGSSRRLKGFIVGTEFTTDASPSRYSRALIEDPDIPGEAPLADEESADLGTVVAAVHYSRVFSKLGLPLVSGSLAAGYPLAVDLSFPMQTWICLVPPFEGVIFIGGLYRTAEGPASSLTEKGWIPPIELGRGHLAFVGLALETARIVLTAARGSWRTLGRLETATPKGPWSSEFGWLLDGTVCAPGEFFLPAGMVAL